jgi:ABC-type spermidine/putrescine transport system permease subunit II
MDPRFAEAAADLGASPFVVSRTVTWPLAMPAFIAGALLSFTFSFDDVIVSMFVSTASTTPLPVYILGSIRQGLKGDVAAVSSFMFLVTVLVFVAVSLMLARSTRNKKGVVLLLAGRAEGMEEKT